MTDKIEDHYDDNSFEGAELWELLGYSSKEEYEVEEAKEKQKALEQSYKDEDEVRRAIESGEYYDPEELEKELAFQIQQDMDRANKEFAEFQAKKEITFDDIIDKFAPTLIGLKGESYKPATKMIFYSILANQIKNNYFYADGKKIDLRIPLLIMIKAGHGKKGYERFIKKTIQGLSKDYSEPTSYHPEQFLGKVEWNKEEDLYFKIPGYLASDYIIIDEAYELLTSEKEDEKNTLKYIRTALDPIGDNEIEKKQVGIPHDQRLHYFPTCTISLMAQPIAEVNEDLLTRGSFRRFAIILLDTPIEERMQARREVELFSDTTETDNKKWDIWIRNNKTLSERKLEYIYDRKELVIIDDYIDKIIKELQLDSSKEALEFINSIQYNVKYLIIKMAIVRAIVEQIKNNKLTISKRHIQSSISDFNGIWIPQLSWIRKKLVARSDAPVGWKEDYHGWILENLRKSDRLQKDVIDKYAEKFSGTYKESTLKMYAGKAIKDLIRWGEILSIPTGNKNERILKYKDR